jgi:hypothetical protein
VWTQSPCREPADPMQPDRDQGYAKKKPANHPQKFRGSLVRVDSPASFPPSLANGRERYRRKGTITGKGARNGEERGIAIPAGTGVQDRWLTAIGQKDQTQKSRHDGQIAPAEAGSKNTLERASDIRHSDYTTSGLEWMSILSK